MLHENRYENLVEISKSESQNIKYVKRSIRQKFLSPKIIKVITSNDNAEIGVEALSNLTSWDWKTQEKVLLK